MLKGALQPLQVRGSKLAQHSAGGGLGWCRDRARTCPWLGDSWGGKGEIWGVAWGAWGRAWLAGTERGLETVSGKPGAGEEEEEEGCAEAAVLAVPGASPPVRAARSQPPQRPQFPKQREQALLPPMPCLRLDDSLPPPELHLQALIDACHDAQLPRAGAGEQTDGVLLGMLCGMAPLAQRPVPQQHIPRERRHRQRGLTAWPGAAVT